MKAQRIDCSRRMEESTAKTKKDRIISHLATWSASLTVCSAVSAEWKCAGLNGGGNGDGATKIVYKRSGIRSQCEFIKMGKAGAYSNIEGNDLEKREREKQQDRYVD